MLALLNSRDDPVAEVADFAQRSFADDRESAVPTAAPCTKGRVSGCTPSEVAVADEAVKLGPVEVLRQSFGEANESARLRAEFRHSSWPSAW